MDDADDLLPGREALEDLDADRLCADAFDEVLDDLEVYISLKQRQAYFAQGILDILLGHQPLAAELLENRF